MNVMGYGAGKGPIIHVVDDEPVICTALQKIVVSAGLQCRTYQSGGEFLAAKVDWQDLVVADIHLPDMNGIGLLESMEARGHKVPVLVITGFATVGLAVKAMKAGAVDFLEKPFGSTELIEKLNTCLAVGRMRYAERKRRNDAAERLSFLSEREMQVLQYVIKGNTNKVIGLILNISIKTVEAHRARIMEKTGAMSLIDLTRLWDVAGAPLVPPSSEGRTGLEKEQRFCV